MNPTLPRRSAAFVCLSLLSVACGGGGGGTPVQPKGSLAGQLSLTPGSTPPTVVDEQEPNSSIFEEQYVGPVDVGATTVVRGRITNDGSDVYDVFRFKTSRIVSLQITLAAETPPPGAQLEVLAYDVSAQNLYEFLVGTGNPKTGTIAVQTAGYPFDLLVRSKLGASKYTLTITGTAPSGTVQGVGGGLSAGPGVLRAADEPALATALAAHLPMVTGEVVVQHRTTSTLPLVGVAPARVRTSASGLSVVKVDGLAPLADAALATAKEAARMLAQPGVVAASPNYLYQAFVEPGDEHYGKQWHYAQIRLPEAWDLEKGSQNVTVAVIDTGIASRHPDLQGRLTAGYDFVSDASRSLDGDGIDPDPEDPGDGKGTGQPSTFHGTHVAGTIGAATNNANTGRYEGVAGCDWNCKVMPVRVLGKGGSGSLADIAEGIRYAAGLENASGAKPAKRADIVNMSLGGPGGSAVLQAACDAAKAAGCLLVVAAGNDNSGTDNFPAAYASCLSVGAVRFDKKRAPYSNYASTIDIVAPGGDVTVDQNGDGFPDGVLSTTATDDGKFGYRFLNGTSMAAPHVAGVAALCRSAKPTASPDELFQILTSTASDLGIPTQGTFPNRLLDALGAVRAAKGAASGAPALQIGQTRVDLGNVQTTFAVTLGNAGGGRVEVGTPVTTYESGTGWLSALLAAPTSAISASRLELTVDRRGLAVGSYRAKVAVPQLNPTNSVTVRVDLQVGGDNPLADKIYVLLVDAVTLETRAQVDTDAARGFAFAFPSTTDGNYVLVAGTDRDENDLLGEEFELFGVWPTLDAPKVLPIVDRQDITGLDFPVGPISFSINAAGTARPTFRLLHR